MSSVPMITRFAPSPTGYLHVGNARMALINWLLAQNQKGAFLLRLDDTDTERSTEAFAQAIKRDLAWLGLSWDEVYRQSDRQEIYDKAIDALKKSGRLYPCYETPEELAFKRKRQLAKGEPPLYDRAGLALTPNDIQRYEAEGRHPHWRFKLEPGTIAWDDLVHGPIKFDAAHLGDPIVIRSGGQPVFTLVGMIDDIDMKVTHILRGDDHLSNTAIQLQIREALLQTPLYADAQRPMYFGHFPLLTGKDGEGLSKRLGSQSLQDFRQMGVDPLALASLLATMGTSDPIHLASSIKDLVQSFDLSKFSSSSPKFDTEELYKLNLQALRSLDTDAINERLASEAGCAIFEALSPEDWAILAPNVESMDHLRQWLTVLEGTFDTGLKHVSPVPPPDFFYKALEAMPDASDSLDWSVWIDRLKKATGLKGRALILPVRLALSGMDHGPDMPSLLKLLGHQRVKQRLEAAAAGLEARAASSGCTIGG